jgi:predicted glutamine amidotransferase
MCRLLGLLANKPVDLEFSLVRFKEFSGKNPDGWGIGWYENNRSEVFKQGISATELESKLPQLSKEVISKVIIAHVRKGTGTIPSDANSHPFKYKNWLFAHNGSVDRDFLLSFLRDEYKNQLKGKTDSEVFFYWILQNIEECANAMDGINRAVGQVLKRDHTGLNFLLSDGKSLYVFRYSSRLKSWYSLFILNRMPSQSALLEFVSQDTRALLRSKSLKGERAILICSEKLTEENWEEIGIGKILKIDSEFNIEEADLL